MVGHSNLKCLNIFSARLRPISGAHIRANCKVFERKEVKNSEKKGDINEIGGKWYIPNYFLMVLEGGWGEGGRGLQEGEGSSIEKEGF